MLKNSPNRPGSDAPAAFFKDGQNRKKPAGRGLWYKGVSLFMHVKEFSETPGHERAAGAIGDMPLLGM
jgi:hypothetical protein